MEIVWYSVALVLQNDDSEGEQAEMDENLTDSEEPEKEVKPVLKTKQLEDTEKSPDLADEPDGEENPDSEGISAEDIETVPEDSQNGPEEKSHSEDKEADESSSTLKEVSNEEDKSDSEGNQETNESSPTEQKKPRRGSLDPSDAPDAEISDDEPLVLISTLCI
ncbi:hypothetical protein CFP56_001543 [Quercus suber]|uniref:Uncharacterized protein n=1 Tax=Quercus suber TaxID=58331 RepID=A0AAW0IM00_QUESU